MFPVRARLPGHILVTGALGMEWRTRQQGSRISLHLAVMDAGQRLLSMTSVLVREDKTSSLFRTLLGQDTLRTRTTKDTFLTSPRKQMIDSLEENRVPAKDKDNVFLKDIFWNYCFSVSDCYIYLFD